MTTDIKDKVLIDIKDLMLQFCGIPITKVSSKLWNTCCSMYSEETVREQFRLTMREMVRKGVKGLPDGTVIFIKGKDEGSQGLRMEYTKDYYTLMFLDEE